MKIIQFNFLKETENVLAVADENGCIKFFNTRRKLAPTKGFFPTFSKMFKNASQDYVLFEQLLFRKFISGRQVIS
jgi:hypothetical protein